MNGILNVSAALYRVLLLCYPREFRESLGAEMVETFRDRCRAALRRGVLAYALIWPGALWSAVRNGLAERASQARRSFNRADLAHFGDGLRYDFVFALRSLLRRPRFAIFAVSLLALGMAGATGVFAVYHALLLAPPVGVHNSGELVGITRMRNGEGRFMSYPEYDYFRQNARSFRGLVASGQAEADLAVNGPATKASVRLVSADYFRVLQVELQRGGGFTSEQAAEAVISDRLWRELFDGAASALGRRILLNSTPFTVVGIAPAGFTGLEVRGDGPDLWTPLQMQRVVMQVDWSPLTSRSDTWLAVLGRLAPGATVERAQQELSALTAQLARDFPATNRNVAAAVTADIALSPAFRATIRTVLTLLLVLIGLLQLMTCANLANLLLTRGLALRTDLAVRAALGARPGRLVRQPVLEAMVLSLTAGVLGVLGSMWVATIATHLLRVNVTARPSAAVLGFAGLLCAVTALLSGVGPALRSARAQLGAVLRSGSASADVTSTRTRAALLLVQVALATVLLVVSGAFVDSLRALQRVELGFSTQHLYAARIDLERPIFSNVARHDLYVNFLARVRALPGVEGATLTGVVPMSGHQRGGGFGIAGRESEGVKEAEHNTVVPGFFTTVGTPLLRGRDFGVADARGAPPVIIVNRALAEREWPNQDPIGHRILREPNGPTFEIVGVVENARYYAVDEPPVAMFFFPFEQRGESAASVLVRTRMDRVALASALARELGAIDPRVTLSRIRAIEDYTDDQLTSVRASARLTSIIGVLAFVLAALGVFSVVSYNIAQRRREIAVRLALGATGSSILLLLVRPGLVLTVVGLGAGSLAARVSAVRITAALNQMRPLDLKVLMAAVGVLGLSALAACLIPAARSLRVDVRRMLGPE